MSPKSRFFSKIIIVNKAAHSVRRENINGSLLEQRQALKGQLDEKENFIHMDFSFVHSPIKSGSRGPLDNKSRYANGKDVPVYQCCEWENICHRWCLDGRSRNLYS